MKGLSLVEGAQPREFSDIIWQIADKRGCDEVAIRYDCGHAIRADVWAPTIPKTREYGLSEAERRRFMQHSLFVMTREPGAPRVQITVPDGVCRICQRGQRQMLVCGPLQMDLADAPMGTRRLELPMSSHSFLAVMAQVCRLPDGISAPPIPQGKDGSLKPFDGPALSREGLRPWSRREVEDSLSHGVSYCLSVAFAVLCILAFQGLFFLRLHLAPTVAAFEGESPFGVDFMAADQLRNMSSVGSFERSIANSTWVLSMLTVAVHKTFAPDSNIAPDEAAVSAVSAAWLWSYFVHPLWVALSGLMIPLTLAADLVLATVLHLVYALTKNFMVRPSAWAAVDIVKLSIRTLVAFVMTFIVQPIVVLSQIPILNPLIVAIVLALLVAAASAPQPPSLPLPNLWSELPSLDAFAPSLKKVLARSKRWTSVVQYFKSFGGTRKENRAKGGKATAARGSGGRAAGRTAETGPGRPDKAHAGKQDAKAAGGGLEACPPCVVCLDRPSNYILEPCGHRAVCGQCAVQLVEAAATNRGKSGEGAGGGGCCPSCGMAISRAMRLFS